MRTAGSSIPKKPKRDTAVSKYRTIDERLSCYEELQKQKHGVESYQTVLAKDRVQLENAFDELHSHYVKQKETNNLLLQWVKEAETYLTELHKWHQQASKELEGLMNAKEALKEEIKQRCEAIQKEHEAKLAVERTKTKKQGLQMVNLKEDLLLLEQEKQQLSQICDDLMKQLELNTEV